MHSIQWKIGNAPEMNAPFDLWFCCSPVSNVYRAIHLYFYGKSNGGKKRIDSLAEPWWFMWRTHALFQTTYLSAWSNNAKFAIGTEEIMNGIEANRKRQYFNALTHKLFAIHSNANVGFGGGIPLPCGSVRVCIYSVNIDSFSVHRIIYR